MKRHVSAYLEAIFRFTNDGYIDSKVGTVWLDVEISPSAFYSEGYIRTCVQKSVKTKN
jgi:hypothetical protein